MSAIDRSRLASLTEREERSFVERHPRSRGLFERAQRSLLGGVPMTWMMRWAGAFPVFVAAASGAHFQDVDGHDYVDLCLGDTGAMTGHSPAPMVKAVTEAFKRGVTLMLPTDDAIAAGEELQRRFGLAHWQFTLSATDANRFAIRVARQITGRPKVLVYNHCYHGTVDETVVTLDPSGRVVPRAGNVGPPVDPALTTRVVEFNDLEALERELAHGDVAVVLAEPALTNIGIVLPDEGYHQALREITRRHGTLLLIDETHTICCGPGGYTALHGLEPDILVFGKPMGSGIPCGTYGITAELGDRYLAVTSKRTSDVGGIGGTLAGYALSLAAIRATLGEVLTEGAYSHMIPLAERWEAGVNSVIQRHEVPWHVTRLGCRAEYHFTPTPPRTGAEAAAAGDADLEEFLHLYALNRGILLTPFHNMALMSPATTEQDVDHHTDVFGQALAELVD